MGRSPCCSKEGLNRGAWTAHEDKLLTGYIKVNGEGRWRELPQKAGLKRCGKSCRLRWLNYLRPDIKRGNISPDEEDLIIRLHNLLGNRWSLIAGRLPGRTDNEVKNYWNTVLSKKVHHHRSSVHIRKNSDKHDEKMQQNVNNQVRTDTAISSSSEMESHLVQAMTTTQRSKEFINQETQRTEEYVSNIEAGQPIDGVPSMEPDDIYNCLFSFASGDNNCGQHSIMDLNVEDLWFPDFLDLESLDLPYFNYTNVNCNDLSPSLDQPPMFSEKMPQD